MLFYGSRPHWFDIPNEEYEIINEEYAIIRLFNMIPDLATLQSIIDSEVLSFFNRNNEIVTQEYTLEVYDTSIHHTSPSNTSSIDMGKCEVLLRNKYKIFLPERLVIYKLDIKTSSEYLTNRVQYAVFAPNGTKLELDVCDGRMGLCLLCHERNGIGLVVFDTYITLVYTHSLHDNLHTLKNLLGMLQHQTVVGCEIGLTLHSIDDDTFGLASWRRTKLHMAGEGGSAHTYDTGVLDLLYDHLAVQFGMLTQFLQLGGTVDALFPFITLYVYIYCHTTSVAGIKGYVDLGNLTAHTTVNGSADKTTCLTNTPSC